MDGRIIDFNRTSETYLRLAGEKYDKEDYFGSLVLLRRAEELYPDDGEIKLRIVETLIAMECYETALDPISVLLDRRSEFCTDAVSALGLCYMGMHEYGAARDAFNYFIANASDDYTDDDIGEAYAMIDACDTYEEIYGGDEVPPPVRDASEIRTERLLHRAMELTRDEKYDEVVNLIAPELERGCTDTRLIHLLLTACYCGHASEKGIKILEGLKDSERAGLEENVDDLCLMQLLYHETGNVQKVDELLKKIMQSGIKTVDELLHVSIVLLECGKTEEALEVARNVYNDCPYEINVIHNYAHAAYAAGNAALAKKLYDRILIISPGNSAAKYYRTLCMNEDAGRDAGSITPELRLPASELMRRAAYVQQKCLSGERDAAALWSDEEFRNIADWALSSVHEPFFGIFLMLLPAVDSERLFALLRRLLIDCEADRQLKEMAVKILDDMGRRGPHFIYSRGRLLGCTTFRWDEFMDGHITYRRIWDKFESCCGFTDDDELMDNAELLMKALVVANCNEHPSVPPDQQAALAAAIEYRALERADESAAPDMQALLEKYGVTLRRFNNALTRLRRSEAETYTHGSDK